MLTHAGRTRTPTDPGPWSRNRLLGMLAGITVAAMVLVTGLGLALWQMITTPDQPTTVPTTVEAVNQEMSVRDRIAAEPMASLDPEAAFTPDAALTVNGSLRVPLATIELGPAGVPSGFPQTPEGAVGQLAAIEKTVLESMSLPLVRDVHQGWVLPGGPAVESWELTRNVQSFLVAARQGGQEKDLTTLVTVTPAAALVKGSDGPDWTLACVLLDVQVAIKTEARMGYGLCSRMQWEPASGRWMVAPGPSPAAAPSAWPGSSAAAAAGWLTWIDEVG